MSNTSRRGFLGSIPAFLLLFINCSRGIDSMSAPELKDEVQLNKTSIPLEDKSVAGFLDKHFTNNEYQSFDSPEGDLLISFCYWGLGEYIYFIDSEYIDQPIKKQGFDPKTQKLVIKKYINGFWKQVYPQVKEVLLY